jgi:hypothetical protein
MIIRRYGLLALLVLILASLVVASLPLQAQQPRERCFDETEYCISGRILEFWEANGGLPVFGLPIGPQQEATIGDWTGQVQWFERNRLELHPENEPPYDVLLGRLGVDLLEMQGRNWFAFPKADGPQDGCMYFEQTQQNVCSEILTAWQVEGIDLNGDGISGNSDAESLALFGLPISGEITEQLSNGQEYTVQYFERARFERHPENEPPYNVLLGLLGREIREPEQDTPAPQEPPAGETATPVAAAPTATPSAAEGGSVCFTPINPDDAPDTPVRIVSVDKVEETVRLLNVSGEPIDLTGWTMCSVSGNEEHQGIGGILEPAEEAAFTHRGADKIWSNGLRDDGMLFDDEGTFISYWEDE